MKTLECIAAIIAIITFLLAIISKIMQFYLSNKDDKTILRAYRNEEDYIQEIDLGEGEDFFVLYNPEENIFNIRFYVGILENEQFRRKQEYKVPKISKLISGEKILIKTIIPEGIPNLEISWNTKSGNEISAIVYYNGKDGLNLSIIKYKRKIISFLYYFFK